MHFASPDNLYWLLVLVPMIGVALWYGSWQRRVRERIGDAGMVEQMAGSRSTTLRLTRIGLVVCGMALLCLAAAQPKWGRVQTSVEQKGVDVVFALDLSKSMLARDVPPTRLQAASDEIQTILDRLSGDRVGMVVFTTVSFVQSPLTTDYGALRFYLDKLDPQQMSVGGTAIGGALRDSVELLTGESLGGSEESSAMKNARMDRAENQIVVLMTDGEDHETDPVSAAKTARDRGVHVLTVGVGTEEGAKIPVYGSDDEIRGYKRDQSGNPVRTTMKKSQLRDVADAGGGIFMAYNGDGSVADRVLEFVDQLQKSTFDSQMAAQYHDRYLWFLVPGFLMLLAAYLIGERRRGRLGWSREAAETTMVLLVAVGALGTTGCKEMFRSQPHAVEQGNDAVRNGNFQKAIEAYDRAESDLENPPPTLFYNRGLAELGNEDQKKARTSFAEALESPDAAIRFDAHLNVGLSFARNEEWKSALDEFRSAFRLAQEHPDAIDESALEMLRHNTELAYYNLYPPCRTQEDDLEDNDQPNNASRLQKPSKKDLTLCGLDDDWYVVDAAPGATVDIEATFEKLGEHKDPTRTFLPNRDDLKVELYGAGGETQVAADHGDPEADGPPPSEGSVERSIDSVTVDESMPLGDESKMLVRVAAADKLQFSYDLEIDVQPPCRALEDDAEENDSPAAAAQIEDGAHQMQLCPGDPDWFKIDAEMGDSVFVDVRPMKRKGRGRKGRSSSGDKLDPSKLNLEMRDADTGESLGNPRREGPYHTAGVQSVTADRSFEVGLTTEGETGGAYRLRVYVYPPCIVGDDRFEENDQLPSRAKLPKKQNQHRYLRLCPDDPDFYAARPKAPNKRGGRAGGMPGGKKRGGLPPGAPGQPKAGQPKKNPKHQKKSLKLGLQRVGPGGESGSGGTIEMEALEGRTGDVLTSAQPPETAGSPSDDSQTKGSEDEGTDESARFDRVLAIEETDKSEIPVRVAGDPTFYHLVELPENNKSGNRQQNRDQQNQQNKKSDNNQQNSKQNDQQQNQQNQNDPQNQNDQKKNRQNRPNNQQQKANQDQKKKQRKSAGERRMEDILKALEDSDKNFQMNNALEDDKNQGRDIEKDW
jgi:Ca-activated chloride channel family protein